MGSIVAIIQARMGSSRLPGKVLMDLCGEPMLVRVLNRVSRAAGIDGMVVATSDRPMDDAIERLCELKGWPCFRGSEQDVLDRYYRAALKYSADVIVRITSDCPLTDPGIIARAVCRFSSSQPPVDYLSNTLKRTFPRGLDVEVFGFPALERAWREDGNPQWREHVTPYIYRHPELFALSNLESDTDFSDMRWTVDTEEDLEFVRSVYAELRRDDFGWGDVLLLLDELPELREINRDVPQKEVPG